MIPTVLIAMHFAASIVLAAYGAHRLFLAVRFRRVRRSPLPPPLTCGTYPSVTVQVPLYNERFVAERAILAAGALEYPREHLVVQVLDDSTDETCAIAAQAVAQLRAAGIDARHIRRRARTGYKAGALQEGLRHSRSELVAIFDADFIPQPDFLLRLVDEFRDPGVGMVQARWGHVNADCSLLTRAQALQLDAHFTVEHGVRAATECFFNFNGTAGIWRRRAITTAGGWQADTLTEDLDLSYRAQLAGWRFVYRDDVEVPAEVPVEVAAYRVQQQRWAQGGVQTALKILPRIARATIPRRAKLEAFWHLTGNLAYPALALLALAGVGSALSGFALPRSLLLGIDSALLGFAAVALTSFYGVAARARRPTRWWKRLGLVPVIMVLGAGIALGQAAAVFRGLRRTPTPFYRTPKYRVERPEDRVWRTAPYRLAPSRLAMVEFAIGTAVLAIGLAALLGRGAFLSGTAALLGLGFLALGLNSLAQRPGADANAAAQSEPSPSLRHTPAEAN